MPHLETLRRIRSIRSRRTERGTARQQRELARLRLERAREERAATVRVALERERQLVRQARATARRPSKLLGFVRGASRVGGQVAMGLGEIGARKQPRQLRVAVQPRVRRKRRRQEPQGLFNMGF